MTPLVTSKEIDAQTKILGKQIADLHREDDTPIVMLCLLNGGFMFFSDLVKAIDIDVNVNLLG